MRPRDYRSFCKVNEEDLLREWNTYRSQPHIDYCHGEGGCGHAHSFEAFKRREYDAYIQNFNDEKRCPKCGQDPFGCQQWPEGHRTCEEA